jgi:hypothetical protein
MKLDKRCLWEILVPATENDGSPVELFWHREWDDKVRKISKGLTIMTKSKGQWLDHYGNISIEEMIPVRFMATKTEARDVVEMTKDHYKQKSVMLYKISDEVYFV